ETTGCVAHDPAIEHQADLAGAADIEVLADNFLEKDAACNRLIQDLGERELGLPDGHLISIARRTVAWRKRMRQAAKPFAQELVDPAPRQSNTQAPCPAGGG